jgi:superfamily II DNA/RNA helicase
MTFGALGVPAPVVTALAAMDRTEPFPIQADTLPDSLAGRDVLGRGKTGSGKTLAFAIPMVARLGTKLAGGRRRGGHPLGLILAPTRELASQIAATVKPLADAYGLTVTTIFGGVSQNPQAAALKNGVDIVVACPGRLEDLMKQGLAHLDAIEITVLDEADHMADLGFLPVVTRILDKTPRDGQRMLFSATLDNGVDKIVNRFLTKPVLHSVDEATSHVSAMQHRLFEVTAADKPDVVKALASGTGRRLLFMRTKHHAKKLAKQLTDAGIPAADLHGNLSQGARDRNLAAFADGSVRVLVATDVAARGVHVDDIELVIHVDPPTEHKAYLHRSGRTARAGKEGTVVTVMLPAERSDTLSLLRKAAIDVHAEKITPSSPALSELVGEVAAYVTPAPRVEVQQGGGRSQGANAQRKRAVRDDQPNGGQRRDRSGRPDGARSGQSRGASSDRQGGQGRPAQARTAPTRASDTAQTQPAAARSGSRRAGAASGAAKLMVGSVVRGNSGGRGR